MAIENKNFTGGLNSDTEDRLIPNGDYRYALNCRLSKSDGANEGVVENTKGNTLVSIDLPQGENKTIGSYDNLTTNKVYYFIFNNKGNHSIYEFDASTKIITLILQSAQLNFKSNRFIDDPTMIDDLLFFNDRENPPRRINVERAKSNGYPTPFKQEYINQAVNAPGFPPEVEYTDDQNINTNNVRGKLFQFRYKYIYLDNEESAWSPISKVPLPNGETAFRPFLYYPTNINNAINVTVNRGDEFVKAIKIAVREGNSGDFLLATTIEKRKLGTPIPSSDYVYTFYNDENYIPLDNDGNEGMRLFDWAPQKADSMALIDGNRIALGSVTENYDPVDLDVEVDVKRDISVEETAPTVEELRRIDRWNGYGSSNPDPFNPGAWVFSGSGARLRSIGSKTYHLFGGRAAFRPTPVPTAFKDPFGNYNPTFSKPTNSFSDRVLILESGGVGGQKLYCTESLFTEFTVEAPQNPGARYAVRLKVQFYDLGDSDIIKTRVFTAQYTSVAGDTAASIANALKNEIINLGTVKIGNVTIDFDRTQSGTYSYQNGAQVASGKAVVSVWTHGVVLAADKNSPDPSPPFPTATGGDTAALSTMSCDIDAYASWTLQNRKSLKAGSRHGIGIVYYDSVNRSGLTNIPNERTFYVPFFTELNIPSGSVPNNTYIDLTIKHKAPEWADKYQIVYTGNQTVENLPGAEDSYKGFLHFKLADFGQTAPASTSGKTASLANITNYNDVIPEDVDLDYSFTKGDRIRFITDANNDYFSDYRDVEIISYDDTNKIIEFKDPNLPLADGVLVEIYTPKKQSGDEIVYHEVGECFPIQNGFHTGNIQDQGGSTNAIVRLEDIGDVYIRYREAPIGAVVESYSHSDYYVSNYWDKGRPNKFDNNIEQIKRVSTIRYSEPYIPNTNINGLSAFYDFNFEDYDQQYGEINRMYPEDKDLIVLQRLKVGKVRVGQDTLYSNEGTSVATVKSQNTVLSDIVYYSGEYGIGNNPESFAVYGNRKYFTDVPRGVVLRLSTDGLTPISENFMHNYFNDTFTRLINDGGDYRVLGQYDVRFGEYIISIQGNINNIEVNNPIDIKSPLIVVPPGVKDSQIGQTQNEVSESFEAPEFSEEQTSKLSVDFDVLTTLQSDVYVFETIAFSEVKKRWSTFYSYIPDYMVSNNISFLSFKDGELYIHNQNPLYNNFYGEQFPQQIKFVSNANPTTIKFYNNIFTESTSPFSMPEATNQFGQKTSLIESDFFDDEGVFKSEILMDENTPNVTNPLIEGDNIRCHSLTILLQNSDTKLVKLTNVGIGLNLSELTGR